MGVATMRSDTANLRVTDCDPKSLRLALRPPEAALALGISERLLWSKTKAGEIPHCRINRAIVYPVDALRAWLAVNAKGGDR
jgi:predicted DNA-binding transcriptional regulator AlpA